jgi:hypothetical protein
MPTYRIRMDVHQRCQLICEQCEWHLGKLGEADVMTGLSAIDVLRLFPELREQLTRHKDECRAVKQ